MTTDMSDIIIRTCEEIARDAALDARNISKSIIAVVKSKEQE